MPIDYRLRPPYWRSLSLRLRSERAAWRCEWCGAEQGKPNPATGSRVVLTVAHLGLPKPDGTPGNKYDVMDCREDNLAVLCQRCHLNFDRADIIRTQRRHRRERQVAAGQLYLLEENS
jgi:hypothetical protein